MPLMAPANRERIAANRNGMRNHVGRMVASAPMGSAPMALDRFFEDAANSNPPVMRMTSGKEAPKTFQKAMANPGDVRDW